MAEKKRLLTGLQPSGVFHIGNYFGAIKPFLELSNEHESFLLVVDYHALTTVRDPKRLREDTRRAIIDYLACGLDPEKVTVFRQSDVKEHLELAWIFECLVTVPFLMQAHAYKDKVAKGLEANAGLFNYPMLMAADILLYDADLVPVGEDQRQHIEYAREAAGKFNNAYKELFKAPKELIYDSVGVVPGTDGQKMSKSYKNTIPLFASKDEIAKSVMSVVTNSDGGIPQNLFSIHKLYKSKAELTPFYEQNTENFKAIKEALIEDINDFIQPLREKRAEIEKDSDYIEKVLTEGMAKAQAVAQKKIIEVRKTIGID